VELIKLETPMDGTIFDVSDLHYGALNCRRDLIDVLIDDIDRTKQAQVYLKGDLMDAITPDDKRFKMCSVDVKAGILTPHDQADAILKQFRPVKKKISVINLGNHEYKLLGVFDFTKYLASGLEAHHGGYSCKVHHINSKGETLFKIFATHGGGSLTRGGKDLETREGLQKSHLRRKLGGLHQADAIYSTMGHCHQLLVSEPTANRKLNMVDDGVQNYIRSDLSIKQNAPYIPDEFRWYGCSGSFLDTFTPSGSQAISYSEVGMFGPTKLGYIKIHVQGGEIVEVEPVCLNM